MLLFDCHCFKLAHWFFPNLFVSRFHLSLSLSPFYVRLFFFYFFFLLCISPPSLSSFIDKWSLFGSDVVDTSVRAVQRDNCMYEFLKIIRTHTNTYRETDRKIGMTTTVICMRHVLFNKKKNPLYPWTSKPWAFKSYVIMSARLVHEFECVIHPHAHVSIY